jgi:hypothetical protein
MGSPDDLRRVGARQWSRLSRRAVAALDVPDTIEEGGMPG